jgi:hypothetical protein
VLVEETGPKLGERASQRMKKQLGYAKAVKVEKAANPQGPTVPAKRVVSKKQIQKNADKQEVIEENVELDFYGVREVLDRSALAFSDCMNTFNTVRFCRGGVSGTQVAQLSARACRELNNASLQYLQKTLISKPSTKTTSWQSTLRIERIF